MPSFCAVVGCNKSSKKDSVKFYRFPSLDSRSAKLLELSSLRQKSWIEKIRRTDLNLFKLGQYRICSDHFVSGRSAHITEEDNPDWVPNQNMGEGGTKEHDPDENTEDYTLLTNYGNSSTFSVENKYNPDASILAEEAVKKLESQHDNIENILICRICMQNNHLRPIFNDNQFLLADMIRTCAEVEISLNDGLPNSICVQCEKKFAEAFELRLQTRKSDEILRNMLFKYHGDLNPDISFDGDANSGNVMKFTQISHSSMPTTSNAQSSNTDDDNFHSIFLPEINMELKEEVIDIDEIPELAPAPFLPLVEDVPFVCPEPPLPLGLLPAPAPPKAPPQLKTEQSDDDVDASLSKIKSEPRAHKESRHKESRSHRKKHKKIKVEKVDSVSESEVNKADSKAAGAEASTESSSSANKRRRRPVKSYKEVDEDEDGRARKEKSKKPSEPKKPQIAVTPTDPEPGDNPEFDAEKEIKKEKEEEDDDDDDNLNDNDDEDGEGSEQKKKIKRSRTGEESCDSIVCHVCGKSNFKKASYLKRHIRDMHTEQELECDQCDKKFSTPGSLNVHKKVVHEKRRYHCDQCNRVYITSRDLHVHTLQAHYIGDPKYECEICGAKYKHPFLLRLHKHRSKNYPTHGAGRPGQETRTTNFKCTACDIPYFDCLVSYREHRREHDSKYVCKLCGHTVTTDNLLRAHIRLHNKKYTCDLCEYKTTSMYNLQRHKISHTGVKPFPCTICDKGFTRNEQLKNHLRTHGVAGTANSGDEKLTQNALEYYNNILRYQEVLGKTGGGSAGGETTPTATTPVPTPIPTTVPTHLQSNDLQLQQQQQQLQQLQQQQQQQQQLLQQQQQQQQQTNIPINMQQLPTTIPQ